MSRTYLDWAATAPIGPDIADVMIKTLLGYPGNPSSIHKEGLAAKNHLESMRANLATTLDTERDSVFFTSGASESNAIAYATLLLPGRNGGAVVSAIEHPSSHGPAKTLEAYGKEVVFVKPDGNGRFSPESVVQAIGKSTAFVSIMAVNNETGSVQPIREITQAIRKRSEASGRRIHVHCDASQAFGKIPFSIRDSGVDSCTGSAHKVGGPKGTGFLVSRNPLVPFFPGGGQEKGLRSGTENLASIAGMAAAFEKAVSALEPNRARSGLNEETLIRGLRSLKGVVMIPESRNAGDPGFSPAIVLFSVPGIPGETLVRTLDDSGFAVSSGSACSKSKGDYRVSEAMGIPRETAFSALRVSTGTDTGENDINAFLDALSDIISTLRV